MTEPMIIIVSDVTNGSEFPELEKEFIKAFTGCKINNSKERDLLAWGWMIGRGMNAGGAAMRVFDMGFAQGYTPWVKTESEK